MIVEPPSENEISAYGEWLGLSSTDAELMWIARQALETPIPSPWIECQTDGGDVYFYNTRTKESIWDHPFDSYYKRAIGKYKAGECTKEELTALLSADWLLKGVDNRSSSQHESPMSVGAVNRKDSSARRSSDINNDSPRLVVTISADEDVHASPPENASPVGGPRRRPSLSGSDAQRSAPAKEARADRGSVNDDPTAMKGRVEQLTLELDSLKLEQQTQVDQLTKDLLKAGEYIELLRADNRSMRARMNDAAVRARDLQKDYLVMKQKLGDETKKLELAEQIIAELENRLADMDGDESPATRSRPNQSLLARLCGAPPSCSAVRRRPPTRASTNVSRKQTRPLSTPPSNQPTNNDPYKDLMQLLSSPPPSPLKP